MHSKTTKNGDAQVEDDRQKIETIEATRFHCQVRSTVDFAMALGFVPLKECKKPVLITDWCITMSQSDALRMGNATNLDERTQVFGDARAEKVGFNVFEQTGSHMQRRQYG
jgi:hypothetical protein